MVKQDDFLSRLVNFGNKLCSYLKPKKSTHLKRAGTPFKMELFSLEQRIRHGRMLADAHRLKPGHSGSRLLDRLKDNEEFLLDAHDLLTRDVAADSRITPAAEWLLDNFYVIEEQIRTARRHLPKGYCRRLPHLSNTLSAGLPRVYDIALAAISHGDGRMNAESLGDIVTAYQAVTKLDLGELWAIPIMLRLALIENIRRLSTTVATSRKERITAGEWADKMIANAADDPENLILTVADMARSLPALSNTFVAELTRRIRGLGPSLALPLTWIENRLAENGQTIEQSVNAENNMQAASQVSMSNCIGSLRALDAKNWREFVENVSTVEQTLAQDPAGAYSRMDFATRDHYRHVVEELGRNSRFSESEVAGQAIECALRGASDHGQGDRTAHVGYYLIDDGLPDLIKSAEVGYLFGLPIRRIVKHHALPLYFGAISALTIAFAFGVMNIASNAGLSWWATAIMGILVLSGGLQLAISLIDWLVTLVIGPVNLPGMDFSKGIPPAFRTLVAVPAMLTSEEAVKKLFQDLEVRFLANRDQQLHFALLTDFLDCDVETSDEDEALLKQALNETGALNQKYRNKTGDVFFLFHRSRQWNSQEKIWMGRERKRGKLAALNSFLKGGAIEFSTIVGNTDILSNVKYVITLDADTQLARDSARMFVAAMAHPLNQPLFSAAGDKIIKGHGLIQPRVSACPVSGRSRYAAMQSGEAGLDPYTRASSDVYQDLFGEGSFIGKGIYDVEVFERALAGRLPDNRILSHDLLEGCYARSGLLSGVHLYEEYPNSYHSDAARRHRWIRGDWQIAQWVLPLTPGTDGRMRRNTLSLLSRWKLLDNLRRSLTSPLLTLLLILGWAFTPSPWFWTIIAVAIILIPSLASLALTLTRKQADMTWIQHLTSCSRIIPRYLSSAAFALACLPYEALSNLKAIGRTLWRLGFSHAHLLQWNPSTEADRQSRADLNGYLGRMRAGPLAALSGIIILLWLNPAALPAAGLVLLLWFFSPALAWWLSRPVIKHKAGLSEDESIFLRRMARRTWRFFETFVGPDDNWLPPDNFQEHPAPKVAHRTSPTNIGLALLSNLSAYDFGFITMGSLIERTGHTFRAMKSLQTHHGHFLNWYDTKTLKALSPHYISTVDSGNLAGHLLVLKSGFLEMSDGKIFEEKIFEGLSDALSLLVEAITVEPGRLEVCRKQLNALQRQMETALRARPGTLASASLSLESLSNAGAFLEQYLNDQAQETETAFWLRAFIRQCQSSLDELTLLAPWAGFTASEVNLNEFEALDAVLTLNELAAMPGKIEPEIAQRLKKAHTATEKADLKVLQSLVTAGGRQVELRLAELEKLAAQCTAFAKLDYDFLYDEDRNLLTIGYNIDEQRRDAGYYDLLASEARLASFIGIAQSLLPQENWFSLGRVLTNLGGEPVLLSWSGSMFEYLMPLLVMPVYDDTLLEATGRAAVSRQIEYGRTRNVPWGVSECGYNAFDAGLDYQYRAFGVPGLGLKRGLASDLVIAPYATALALMVAPGDAVKNLARLAAEGQLGDYGFYESVDYTPSRIRRGRSSETVRSFMAHHQGMSLLAMEYQLLNRPMQKRFTADPLLRSALLLLQEKVPPVTATYAHISTQQEMTALKPMDEPLLIMLTPDSQAPETRLLAGNDYQVMITSSGGGYSRWRGLSVTRWREDTTCDQWGQFCYLRDVASGEFWSTSFQPTLKNSDRYQAVFSEGRVEFNDRRRDYETRLEIVVSPEDDLELRRLRITNRAGTTRTIEVTTFMEVVLAPHLEDALHPAFSKLFVETEALPGDQALICSRRPRDNDEKSPWLMHMMTIHGVEPGAVSYETDRLKFIGRGRNAADPEAMAGKPGPLSGRVGSVLDPIAALRADLTLEAGQTVIVDLATGISETRDQAVNMSDKYRDRYIADRVFDLAWTHGQVLLRQLNANDSEAHMFNRLAGSIIYTNKRLRAPESILAQNRRAQSGLWGYSVSGDYPIVLLIIEDQNNIELVRQMLRTHQYWRLHGLYADMVIWNEDRTGYRQELNDQIMALITSGSSAGLIDRPGGIFLRAGDRIADEDRILFQTAARVIISDAYGSLAEQVEGPWLKKPTPPDLVPTRALPPVSLPERPLPRNDLHFYNGFGGFTPDGREYVITTAPGHLTPAPWVNILANPDFGCVVSERGASYTFFENAHEYRLTPWHNDPVSDTAGEAFYLRDEETGHYWSPTPWPCPGQAAYVSRHGFGYSIFEHAEDGLYSEFRIYVAMDSPVKFMVLKVRNDSGRNRRLSVTGYVEWVLGDLRFKTSQHVITEIEPESGAILAGNPYNNEFQGRIAFFDVDGHNRSITCDRGEFIGRNQNLNNPAALKRARLSGQSGAGLDPCAALEVPFSLNVGQEREIIFRLGAGRNRDEAVGLARNHKGPEKAGQTLDKVWHHWTHTLGAVNVETPDQSFNILANGWLLYQTLACRLWARSATYQSGGAFGFRDQLQDVSALIHARPGLTREHLLLCAAHQFLEGDVQHWWHPPNGRGVRTKCSDDYLWLPLTVCRYVQATTDTGILAESINFLEGRPLRPEESSYYDMPQISETSGSLYEHCVKAIRFGLKFGANGLPLIGSGDWNDGLDRVGENGRGESVWLGFFLHGVLSDFSKLAKFSGDEEFAATCLAEAAKLRSNLAAHAWDGNWYRRAFFDDGSPLGSSVNSECKIDAIAQSWSVLSGVGDMDRSIRAMNSLDGLLVDRDLGVVKLLKPPFDIAMPNPGYIKGYVPGVRENGGQYTHAAIWAAMAFADLEDEKRAWELYSIINPISHAATPNGVETYKVEPYVMAADVYAASAHEGRGGWTWYTGSAAWMYRLMFESLLGLRLDKNQISFKPLFTERCNEFKVHYRFRETVYHFTVIQMTGANDETCYTEDGQKLKSKSITLIDDQKEHWVEVRVAGSRLAG